MSPVLSPLRNQRTRCADVPWVKASGTTYPCVVLHDAVVAHGGGGVQPFLDVALLQDVLHPLGVVGPDPGQEIGLQLQPHHEAVVLLPAHGSACCSCTWSMMPSRFCTWWPTSWAMT